LVLQLKNDEPVAGCERMKAVQDYAAWVLGNPKAASIARGLHFAEMPLKLSQRGQQLLQNMTCVR
jgi:hypothetical protein